MSLIPHGFFPRSSILRSMDTKWPSPSQMMLNPLGNPLEAFDPFDQLDHMVGRNMSWLTKPEHMLMPVMPKQPQTYRITLDCAGYSPNSIETKFNGNVLTVHGREENKYNETDDFSIKEFNKTYTVPETAQCDKMVSFMTDEGTLVIEVPLKESTQHMDVDLFPQIVEENGGKIMKLNFAVPANIHPENIHINIKDRCLVVKAEEKKVKPDGVSTFHYYKKTTLPENTDFEALKCNYDNHTISVSAPLNMTWAPKKIAIEHKGTQPSISSK